MSRNLKAKLELTNHQSIQLIHLKIRHIAFFHNRNDAAPSPSLCCSFPEDVD